MLLRFERGQHGIEVQVVRESDHCQVAWSSPSQGIGE
jgi:hypothetical protein